MVTRRIFTRPGFELCENLHEKQSLEEQGDALSDARGGLCQVDDARLAGLIECWSRLSEQVKVEILGLVENDQTTEVNV